MATLTIYKENQFERRVEMGASPLRIGRAPENEIVLDDPKKGVSRFHAEIRPEPNGYRIVDLKSQNGLWVENRRVSEHVLEDSRRVRIGPYQLALGTSADQAAGASARGAASEIQTRELHTGEVPVGPGPVDGSPPTIPRTPVARTAKQPQHGRRRQLSGSLLILGAVVIGIAGVGTIVALRSRRPPPQPPAPVVLDTDKDKDGPPKQVPAPEPPGPAEHLAALIASATAFLSVNQLEETKRAQLIVDEALASDAGNTEASQLKTRTLDQLRRLTVVRPPPTPATQSWPPDVPPVKPRDGESQQQTLVRARAVKDNYENARGRLASGDFAGAILHFDQVVKDEPGYLDTSDLRTEATRKEAQRRRDAAARRVIEGHRLQAALDVLGARREFAAALEEDPASTDARTALETINIRIVAEGEDAVKKATVAQSYGSEQAESYGRVQSLRDLYQKGVNYLPQGNPLRDTAEKNLLALPKN